VHFTLLPRYKMHCSLFPAKCGLDCYRSDEMNQRMNERTSTDTRPSSTASRRRASMIAKSQQILISRTRSSRVAVSGDHTRRRSAHVAGRCCSLGRATIVSSSLHVTTCVSHGAHRQRTVSSPLVATISVCVTTGLN